MNTAKNSLSVGAVFSVVEWETEDDIGCVGTAIAISPEYVLTSRDCIYGLERAHPDRRNYKYHRRVPYRRSLSLMVPETLPDIGVFSDSDLIDVTYVLCDETEDWCVLKRKDGVFSGVSEVATEPELPNPGDEIYVHDAFFNFEYGSVRSRTEYVEWYHRIGENCKTRKRVQTNVPDIRQDTQASDGEDIKSRADEKNDDEDEDEQPAKKICTVAVSTAADTDEQPRILTTSTPATTPSLVSTVRQDTESTLGAVRVTTLSTDCGQSPGCPLVTRRGKVFAMHTGKAVQVLARLPKLMAWHKEFISSSQSPTLA